MSAVFAHLDSDPVLLMLDNSQITHNKCLELVRAAMKQLWPMCKAAAALHDYCMAQARIDLRSVGDHEQANELANSFHAVKMHYINDAFGYEEYWFDVAVYYIQKVREGA